jgi:hypothetical protein
VQDTKLACILNLDYSRENLCNLVVNNVQRRYDAMDLITAIITLTITGVGVGFGIGLLGFGGCLIMTPVQYWVYIAMGVPPDVAIKVALGTSMFVLLPTAISGTYGHLKKGAVWWKAGIVLGIAEAFGALIGATIATHLPGNVPHKWTRGYRASSAFYWICQPYIMALSCYNKCVNGADRCLGCSQTVGKRVEICMHCCDDLYGSEDDWCVYMVWTSDINRIT